MNIEKEVKNKMEDAADKVDEALDEIEKKPKSIKGYVKLLIAIGSLITALLVFLKTFGII